MRKTIFSTILFLVFIILVLVSYLTFFGHETDKFNKIIKSEINKTNSKINLNFEKISIKLNPAKLKLFIEFINPNLNYLKTDFPLALLKTNINLKFLTEKKIVINEIILTTQYLELSKIKPLFKEANISYENLKLISGGKLKIKNLNLKFDENLNIKNECSTVQPLSIYYKVNDKKLSKDFYGWWGSMSIISHIVKILCLSSGSVILKFHKPLDSKDFNNRKELTIAVESIISEDISNQI